MREAVIVSTARTPIGKAYRGAFNNTVPHPTEEKYCFLANSSAMMVMTQGNSFVPAQYTLPNIYVLVGFDEGGRKFYNGTGKCEQ